MELLFLCTYIECFSPTSILITKSVLFSCNIFSTWCNAMWSKNVWSVSHSQIVFATFGWICHYYQVCCLWCYLRNHFFMFKSFVGLKLLQSRSGFRAFWIIPIGRNRATMQFTFIKTDNPELFLNCWNASNLGDVINDINSLHVKVVLQPKRK